MKGIVERLWTVDRSITNLRMVFWQTSSIKPGKGVIQLRSFSLYGFCLLGKPDCQYPHWNKISWNFFGFLQRKVSYRGRKERAAIHICTHTLTKHSQLLDVTWDLEMNSMSQRIWINDQRLFHLSSAVSRRKEERYAVTIKRVK